MIAVIETVHVISTSTLSSFIVINNFIRNLFILVIYLWLTRILSCFFRYKCAHCQLIFIENHRQAQELLMYINTQIVFKGTFIMIHLSCKKKFAYIFSLHFSIFNCLLMSLLSKSITCNH